MLKTKQTKSCALFARNITSLQANKVLRIRSNNFHGKAKLFEEETKKKLSHEEIFHRVNETLKYQKEHEEKQEATPYVNTTDQQSNQQTAESSVHNLIEATKLTEAELLDVFKGLVEELKYDRFYEMHFISKALPSETNAPQFFLALHRISQEMSVVKFKTSNPSTGALRLAWWRSAVQTAVRSGQTNNIPSLIMLGAYAQQLGVQYSDIRSIFKAWERDLHFSQIPDYDTLENLADDAYTPFFNLLLFLNNKDYAQNPAAKRAASHLGKCVGLIESLRRTRLLISSKIPKTYLPADLCSRMGATEIMIQEKPTSQEVRNVVYEVADYAKAHLLEARRCKPDIPKGAARAFLATTFCDRYLNLLEKNNFDITSIELSEGKGRVGFAMKLGVNYFLRRW